jgi:glutamate dehydrogenase
VLISYAKAEIKESLIDSDLINDPYLRQQINTAFPQELTSRYQSQAHDHRLRREILATQLANGLVNHVGITFFDQIIRSTGAVPTEVVRAYILARDVFSMADTRAAIKALDNQVDAAVQQQMLADLNRLMRRATRWFIRTIGEQQDLGSLIEQYQQPVSGLISALPGLLCGSAREATHHRQSALTEAGVPKELANRVAATDSLYALLGIVRSAIGREQSLLQTSEVYFALGETLKLQDFDERIRSMDVDTHWQAVAREGIREELTRLQQAITEAVLSERAEADANVSDTVSTWLARQNGHLSRWQTMSGEIVSQPTLDISMASVAVRELRDLSNRL